MATKKVAAGKQSATKPKSARAAQLDLKALQFQQGGASIYCFALPGNELTRIADISRVKRDGKASLEGFQRPEIQHHVKQIVEYLDKGPGLFPNAVILALSSRAKFVQTRGPKTAADVARVATGTLTIPIYPEGEKEAWIVDGQQRSMALAKSKNGGLLVPVIAFESTSIQTHREQFILVNRAKPLPQRHINELLPDTDDALLPRDLAANKIPSELCNLLNQTRGSPFYNRLSRPSDRGSVTNSIVDSAVIKMIRERINGTSGALLHMRGDGKKSADVNEMYKLLVAYWSAVAATFPEAWKLPPDKSRLTAAVGITIMGVMMDRISARIGYRTTGSKSAQETAYRQELQKIAAGCAWTEGQWDEIDLPWNALEMTSKSSSRVIQFLGSLYVRVASK